MGRAVEHAKAGVKEELEPLEERVRALTGNEKAEEPEPGRFSPYTELNTPQALRRSLKMQATKRNMLRKLELLIIDEVSMVRADLLDAVDAVAEDTKENVFTNQTVDLLLWANPEDYDQSSRLYIDLKRNFEYSGVQMSRGSINRKMLILNLEPNY